MSEAPTVSQAAEGTDFKQKCSRDLDAAALRASVSDNGTGGPH